MSRRRSWPFPTSVIPRLRWSLLWLQKRDPLVAFYHGWFLQNASGDPGEIDNIAHRLPMDFDELPELGPELLPINAFLLTDRSALLNYLRTN